MRCLHYGEVVERLRHESPLSTSNLPIPETLLIRTPTFILLMVNLGFCVYILGHFGLIPFYY